jgi:hypothetical protein
LREDDSSVLNEQSETPEYDTENGTITDKKGIEETLLDMMVQSEL